MITCIGQIDRDRWVLSCVDHQLMPTRPYWRRFPLTDVLPPTRVELNNCTRLTANANKSITCNVWCANNEKLSHVSSASHPSNCVHHNKPPSASGGDQKCTADSKSDRHCSHCASAVEPDGSRWRECMQSTSLAPRWRSQDLSTI